MASVRGMDIRRYVESKHMKSNQKGFAYVYNTDENTYNFYDAAGMPVSMEVSRNDNDLVITPRNLTRSNRPIIHQITRRYVDISEDKKITNGGIYPMSYIYDSGVAGEMPVYYQSPAHLLIANRKRVMEGQSPLVEDEIPYVVAHCRRMCGIQSVYNFISGREKENPDQEVQDAKTNAISKTQLDKMTAIMMAEQSFVSNSFSVYETDLERMAYDLLAIPGITDAEIMEELRDMQM